uniref:Uncharacterized protein n=1 Tax=Romanomermis culicivorax TaxID=13658 RepID=A0A915IK37_ROMCU
MQPSGDSFLVPMNIYNSQEKIAKATRRVFHMIPKDMPFLKIFYGLAATHNFLSSWVPEEVVMEAHSVFDLAYMYDGYPGSPLSRYGTIVGIKDYQHLPDANTLPGMFCQAFGVESSCHGDKATMA